MVVIDATMLMILLRPGAPVPAGPSGLQIDGAQERVDYLVRQLDKEGTRIVVPTPALSEILVRAGATASQQIVDRIQRSSVFQIYPFDAPAAIEVAAMTRNALARGKKKQNPAAFWAKVKYDRQIIAIAKVCGATAIYSDDGDIRAMAKDSKIVVVSLADLPLPPRSAQTDMMDMLATLTTPGKPTGDSVAEEESAADD